MSGIRIKSEYQISKNIIAFNKEIYEPFVLSIMNDSQKIFPGCYSRIKQQSNGECDFVNDETDEKYDAKLPVTSEQVELLTDGKKHAPQITEWLNEMREEAASFNPIKYRDFGAPYIESTKLYQIMKTQVEKNKKDENLIFFLPYPITMCFEGSIFLQFASDYLEVIFNRLQMNWLVKNNIYAIYPASEKNKFVVRKLGCYAKEYVFNNSLEQYFSYQVIGYDCSQ